MIIFTAVAIAVLVSPDVPIRGVDGDTVHIAGEKIRLATIDAPEIRGHKCDAERRLGLVAADRL